MPNSTSKLAPKVNDQYFTPVETAKWCYDAVAKETGWDFVGTALEPAVGGYAFVEAADQLGLELEWTTNDLFPQPGRQPDLNLDFGEGCPGYFDYIITNPPFGHANSLARKFMRLALESADKVMMVLPKGARRIGFQDAMPLYAWRVFDSNLPNQMFEIPGHEPREVQACVQAWENTTHIKPVERIKIKDTLDLRDDLFETWGSQTDDWNHNMDVQVVRWGKLGNVVLDSKQRRSGALMSVRLKDISLWDFIDIQTSLDFEDYRDMCSGAPAFDVPVWIHRFNTEAVRRGLLPPR